MTTGCLDCDKIQAEAGINIGLCPKHLLEHLKWCVESASEAYFEELRLQSRKKETK